MGLSLLMFIEDGLTEYTGSNVGGGKLPPTFFATFFRQTSPLGKTAVGVAPDRVAPAVADGRAFDHVFLVALVVVNAQALLLDKRVVADRVQLQAGGQRDWAQRAVQRQGHVVGFGHVGDLAGFGDAAGVGSVRLDDVDVTFAEHALEVPAREQALAQGNRRAGQRSEFFQGFVVFAEHRLFDKHQFVRVQLFHQHLGHGLVYAAMEVDADAHVRADGIAHGGDVGQGQVDFFEAVDELQFFGTVHFHRGEATRYGFFGGAGGVGGAVAADPRIHANLVTHLAAQQVADRHAQGFALDVPQRLVDAGQCAHMHGAAAIEAAAIEDGPDVFDIAWIFADQVVGQFLNRSRHRVGAAFDHGFAPAGDALVGFHFKEAPARWDDEGRQFGDFHLLIS